jgi:hypothetical protein
MNSTHPSNSSRDELVDFQFHRGVDHRGFLNHHVSFQLIPGWVGIVPSPPLVSFQLHRAVIIDAPPTKINSYWETRGTHHIKGACKVSICSAIYSPPPEILPNIGIIFVNGIQTFYMNLVAKIHLVPPHITPPIHSSNCKRISWEPR